MGRSIDVALRAEFLFGTRARTKAFYDDLSVGFEWEAGLPRYYFDISDNGVGKPDEEGSDHAHDQAASDEAVGVLAHLAKDKLVSQDHREFVAEVLDEKGKLVFHGTLTFRARWMR